jgi:hypothetical protein
MIADLERHISKEEASLKLQGRVEKVVADIIASIPYHLAYDVDEYLKCIQSQRSDITSNRPFSGFLLLYSLFESAKCQIVPHADRLYLLRCLNNAPPEIKLILGIFGLICIPVALFLFDTFSIFTAFSM